MSATGGLGKIKAESGDWRKMEGENNAVDLNEFEKYYRQILRPLNIETGVTELKSIDYIIPIEGYFYP